MYAEKAEAIENEMENKLSRAKASLEESTTRLVGRTANSAKAGPQEEGLGLELSSPVGIFPF